MAADWELALAWLYVPATRTDRFAKAAASADGVVIDLEDAVHAAEKAAARAGLDAAVGDGLGTPTVVRVNAPSTEHFDADIAAVTPLVLRGAVSAIRVAKVDSADEARRAAEATAHWGVERRLIVQLETARAIRDAHEIAAVEGVHSLMLGEADLRADLGLGRDLASADGLLLARLTVVLAARAAGLPSPLASAFVNVSDTDALAADCARQRELGFRGRSCIHPKQVETVRAAFQPSAADVEWARSVLERAEGMDTSGSGVATLADGSFIDMPVIRQAQTIAALAERSAS
ncbi:CoA ester lyase [Salinibacterium sp. dk2585]|uniref:HpcH/HpaI aldolase/citrate lyase family protein n=1 Tax=unclassified Salinibacterium TaxID=2632331 RepID=UPI0011C246C0|nr:MULTISPECIES: CoA ester lyase [unclassified Salinibacterium]QEE60395.1 CoA ester lyase [Salinibacterium sp. dk2585]TXK55468.1 CoA ester lyase [Salinibacterium sp. dk5596]